MRLLFILLAPLLGYSQADTTLTYRTKEAHNINWKNQDTASQWKVDTIEYQVPFEIKISKKSLVIDGYGTFKIDSARFPPQSPYMRYYLPKGVIFCWIEKYAYLTYPIVNKRVN